VQRRVLNRGALIGRPLSIRVQVRPAFDLPEGKGHQQMSQLTTYNNILAYQANDMARQKLLLKPHVYAVLEKEVARQTLPCPTDQFEPTEEVHISHIDRLIVRGQGIYNIIHRIQFHTEDECYVQHLGGSR
jgi:hypothetical protein